MKKFIFILSFNIVFCLFSDSSELIEKGWKEYKLQAFDDALEIFQEAEQKTVKQGATTKELCEIFTGQAFCYQYKKFNLTRESDYLKAISLYEKGLTLKPKDIKIITFLKAMINECNYKIAKLNYDDDGIKNTNDTWDEIIENDNNVILIQDALLTKVLLQTEDYLSPQCFKRALLLENYIEKNISKKETALKPLMLLAPAMSHFLAEMYFYRKNYQKTFDWITKYCEFGPTSHTWRNNGYFIAARIAETKLHNYDLAIKYYIKIAQEKGFNQHAYFAEQKIKKLSKLND